MINYTQSCHLNFSNDIIVVSSLNYPLDSLGYMQRVSAIIRDSQIHSIVILIIELICHDYVNTV